MEYGRLILLVLLVLPAMCSCGNGGPPRSSDTAPDVADVAVESDLPVPGPEAPEDATDVEVVPDPTEGSADQTGDTPLDSPDAAPDACLPACDGAKCGADGCGGTCGTCAGWEKCEDGDCVTGCEAGFVMIPAGEFDMGSPPDDPWAYPDERPVHHVTITRPFCLKQTEVTQEEWQSLMGNNPSFKGLRGNWPFGGDYPLQCVNWWEVFAFCNALSKAHGLAACYELEGWTDGLGCPGTLPGQASLPGQAKCTEDAEFAWPMECSGVKFAGLDCPGYRLPTEAEWEYSARAGTTTATYNGTVQYPDGAFDCDIAGPVLDPIAWWVCNYKGTQHPVAQKLPNAWGAYDMIGNVDEMVWDFLGDYEGYPPEPATDPLGPEAGSHRIIRGGSAPSPVEWCRSAWRFAGLERARLGGFRVVRTAKSPGAATP